MKTKILAFLYRRGLKPILFLFDPERVHDFFLWVGSGLGRGRVGRFILRRLFYYKNARLRRSFAGLELGNPVGLAAGFDKDGRLVAAMQELGFGHVEVGTVTNLPYVGNKPPRLYRLKKSSGIVVNYGLKGEGVDKVILNLKKHRDIVIPVGVSIGFSNVPVIDSVEAAIEDTFECLRKLVIARVGDFYTVNISCPNTALGEVFAEPDSLRRLFERLFELKFDAPVFVKMSINLTREKYFELLKVILEFPRLKAVIIGNLQGNFQDPAVCDEIPAGLKGKISGKPTEVASTELIRVTREVVGERLGIIGCGGVFGAGDAERKFAAGADVLQLATGLIFRGPQVVGEILKSLPGER